MTLLGSTDRRIAASRRMSSLRRCCGTEGPGAAAAPHALYKCGGALRRLACAWGRGELVRVQPDLGNGARACGGFRGPIPPPTQHQNLLRKC